MRAPGITERIAASSIDLRAGDLLFDRAIPKARVIPSDFLPSTGRSGVTNSSSDLPSKPCCQTALIEINASQKLETRKVLHNGAVQFIGWRVSATSSSSNNSERLSNDRAVQKKDTETRTNRSAARRIAGRSQKIICFEIIFINDQWSQASSWRGMIKKSGDNLSVRSKRVTGLVREVKR